MSPSIRESEERLHGQDLGGSESDDSSTESGHLLRMRQKLQMRKGSVLVLDLRSYSVHTIAPKSLDNAVCYR
jgi:hypothetical protein